MTNPLLEIGTINDLFLIAADRGIGKVAAERDAAGNWTYYSSSDLYSRVCRLARSLQSLGIAKGDRVALLSENRLDWAIADFACLALGAVDVPIYPTLTAEQAAYILKDSQCRVAIVSTGQQLEKLVAVAGQTELVTLLTMDDVPVHDPGAVGKGTLRVLPMLSILAGGPLERDPELDRLAKSINAADLATIIYTSGTTGFPKGVMLTHGNLAANINFSLAGVLGWKPGMSLISFLPLSHVTARHVDYLHFLHGCTVAYCPDLTLLPKAMVEIRPTNFVGVPRVYEKIMQHAEHLAGSGPKQKVFRWAMRAGKAHREETIAGKRPASPIWALANALVFRKVRDGFGGEVQTFVSGGAPLGIDTAIWFLDAGVRIFEGYGLTETSPVIAVNAPEAYRLGSVGKPVKNVECKIAADGELLVRGPSVFSGYWNLPQETAAAFDAEGWFHTGDIGSIDRDGFLSILDRKKELLKTSGGKFIAPQPIESKLKSNPLVAHPVVVGDRRKFASVLISPNFALLEEWANKQGITFASREQLVKNPAVQALFEGIVAQVNQGLARFETMKKVVLVPDEFTIESGELTPSLKLKRKVVEHRYAARIEALYGEAAAPETPQPA